MNSKLEVIQKAQEFGLTGYGWLLFISFWAGAVRYLSSLNGKKPTLSGWLIESCVSGFVGMITALVCQYFALDFILTSALAGICAHTGTRSLYLVSEIISSKGSFVAAMKVYHDKKDK